MASVLIIDDDAAVCRMLSKVIRRMDHAAACAHTIKEGLEAVRGQTWDIVFMDVRLPDGSGLDALPAVRGQTPAPEVIVLTGFGDRADAEKAIREGAWDYCTKPVSPKAILQAVNRVIQYRTNLPETPERQRPLTLKGIVGSSPQTEACLDFVARAALIDANVLITGETGAGKELFARAVHYNSDRRRNSFVVVDCAALPETLVESALFGHVKGAFTGADARHTGLIEQADGGTLFLDEIGELSLTMQKSFLRFLQERSFRPVGGKREIKSDFRLIAATNRDLDALAGQERFRTDLLYRIRSLHLDIPPLRERKEDIEDIALYYTAKICARHQTPPKGFSMDFFGALADYPWPGNVRELVNTLENIISGARRAPTLFRKHLPEHIRIQAARAAVDAPGEAAPEPTDVRPDAAGFPDLKTHIAETERRYLSELAARTGFNISEICRISGLSRSRLYAKLKNHGIRRDAAG